MLTFADLDQKIQLHPVTFRMGICRVFRNHQPYFCRFLVYVIDPIDQKVQTTLFPTIVILSIPRLTPSSSKTRKSMNVLESYRTLQDMWRNVVMDPIPGSQFYWRCWREEGAVPRDDVRIPFQISSSPLCRVNKANGSFSFSSRELSEIICFAFSSSLI